MQSVLIQERGLRRAPGDAGVRRYVDLSSTQISYVEAGRENRGAPLLMVHGLNGGVDHWYPYTLPGLAAERHLYALDMPGCGYSGRLARYSLGAYAAVVPAFLDALGIERADLMGHSMGGQIAIAAAGRYPQRVRKLVLVSSSGLRWRYPFWHVPFRSIGDRCFRHVRLYPMFLRTGARARSPFHALRVVRSESVDDYLPLLATPTLIIWGSRDRIVPAEHGVAMARRIPNARLAIMRGVGHMPYYEKPEEFQRLVSGFLGSEPESTRATE